jgi:hypothetical protein
MDITILILSTTKKNTARWRSVDGRMYVKFFYENARGEQKTRTVRRRQRKRACIYIPSYLATPCHQISQEQEKATPINRSILLHRWRRSDVLVLAVCSSVVLRVSSGKQPSSASRECSIVTPSAPWRRPPTDT